MPYRIFISCAEEDKYIGARIKAFLIELFKEKVDVFFYDQVNHRTRWQTETRTALRESDAIISLLTPIFRYKPWSLIELTPFWLEEKHVSVLCLESALSLLDIPLFKDFIFYRLKNTSDIRRFLEGIGQEILQQKELYVPSDKEIELFMSMFSDAINETKLNQSIHQEYTEFLCIRQYELGDFDSLHKTIDDINDDEIIYKVALYILEKNDLKLSIDILKYVYEIKYVRRFACVLFKTYHANTTEMRTVLDLLENSYSELRNFGKFLINENECELEIFKETIDRITNNAELRNLARHFVVVNGLVEDVIDIISLISNDAEIKTFLIGIIRKTLYKNKVFTKIFYMLKNKKHINTVLEELRMVDNQYHIELSESNEFKQFYKIVNYDK